MTGRINLLLGGVSISDADTPALPADYYGTPSEYDQQCRTFGLDGFQLPNPNYPDRFVCDAGAEASVLNP